MRGVTAGGGARQQAGRSRQLNHYRIGQAVVERPTLAIEQGDDDTQEQRRYRGRAAQETQDGASQGDPPAGAR